MKFNEPVRRKEINNDGVGFVEKYDFSKANTSKEARIQCITTVASVCYGNPKAIGSIKLYDRLAMESAGLPSSSYEFVPVLLYDDTIDKVLDIIGEKATIPNIYKYSDVVIKDGGVYILTNLRALIADIGEKADEFFNTSDEDLKIIRSNFSVYKMNVDSSTRVQLIRHRRQNIQEVSRRYVSGNKSPFTFYISDKVKGKGFESDLLEHNENSIKLYNELIDSGLKPEQARRVLPQGMYTTLWSAWQPQGLDSFFKLRLDKHAQSEIREMAEAMLELQAGC